MVKDFETVHYVVDSEGTRVSKFYSRAGDAKRKADELSKYGKYEAVSMFCVNSKEGMWASAGNWVRGFVPVGVQCTTVGKDEVNVNMRLCSTTSMHDLHLEGSYKIENQNY